MQGQRDRAHRFQSGDPGAGSPHRWPGVGTHGYEEVHTAGREAYLRVKKGRTLPNRTNRAAISGSLRSRTMWRECGGAGTSLSG